MNKTLRLIGINVIALMLLAGCNSKGQKENNQKAESEVTVTPVEHSKAFPGATLKIQDIQVSEITFDTVSFKVNYGIENFTLTEHTEDHNAHLLANSHDGQHIHFIMDNAPYAALYKPENEIKLKKGSEHYLLSFLSRSYHESIKEPSAFVLKHFAISNDGKYQELKTPTSPMLFYSRPKGEYAGKDTEAVLLDFYVLNTTLSKDGNKVQASINGENFMLDNWQPYQIKGMPLGENKIKLTLIDASGKPLNGENTSVERTIVLKE
ncbi:hypothetical protein EAVNVH72_03533 [Elizabethkingia anophelis]|uniref:hypothetical protein n=1 Tax=Elizabethkingia anophelis TaxID=1117645 RepID=UPI0020B6FA54|nr:hypothetical protein [Elizabethkingia anophelis]UTG65299.1 hypothetical protein J2O02_01760 [Elizabethkingia anophelis]CAH1152378.1 hypothetical protein EAVNVH72_02399 [Elizabethkingia anophelis]CAI9686918.1 hypothetical protein EAVNVH72_03533 [Elizabethkingia anophelis]